MEACHQNGLLSLLTEEQGDLFGFRQKTSNRSGRGTALVYRMSAKNCQRIPVVALDELFELITRQI
jgi:hypothetical protein